MDESSRNHNENNGVLVSNFDYSVENFLASMDSIKELCGLPDEENFDASEIERFSTMIIFLKEWKYFVYEPKTINFACEIGNGHVKDDFDEICLPQFSSAAVPKMENSPDEERCLDSDFVLHAGGLVWAMDWCPRSLEKSDNSFKCEYLAVAAHPPGSTYHNIGVSLTGRGIIQIWCLLSLEENVEISPQGQRKSSGKPEGRSRGRPKGSYKKGAAYDLKGKEELKVRRPRGRPKGSGKKEELTVRRPRGRPKGSGKKQPHPSENNLNDTMESASPGNNFVLSTGDLVPLLSVDLGGSASGMPVSGAFSGKSETSIPKRRGRPSKKPTPSQGKCVPASENIGALPVSSALNGNIETSLSRCRGRPRTKPTPSANEGAQAFGVDPDIDISALPTSRGPGTLSGSIEPLPIAADLNDKLDSCPLPSSREFGPLSENFLLSAVPDDSTGQHESLVPKRRGRPKRKLSLCVNNSVETSGIELGENLSALPASRVLGTANEDAMALSVRVDLNDEGESFASMHSREIIPISSLTQCISAPAVEVGNNSSSVLTLRGIGDSCENGVVFPIPANVNDSEDSFLKRCSGQPRKQQISNTNKCVQASAVEFVKNSSAVPSSRQFGPSIENHIMKRCQRDKAFVVESCEGFNNRSFEIKKGSTTYTQKQEMNVGYGSAVAFDSIVDQTPPIINENVLTDAVASENCENAASMTNGADDGISLQICEGLDSCHLAMAYGSAPCKKKRKIKDKARAFSHLTKRDSHFSTDGEHKELAVALAPTNDDHYRGEMVLSKELIEKKLHIPKDTALPKVVLCLAHMGKVAWDVKWRPASVNDSEDKHRLGYLAVLLGNGSLEVWEIPVPSMVKILHTCRSDGTDPRFLKLKPVFRCSKVQCGDRQSIPLTMEWSPSTPHDLILAGCHDGTVALWKFSNQPSSQDIKPLLCFSADSVPIRSLAWAPDESDAESANLIVTAGHEGLKFWDMRDPYRPLWEFYPKQRVILSLEWLKDPRCVIMSFDDGAVRMLSLWKVASDVLVTGEPSGTMKQAGLHSYPCSHFAIWSCQVSRATGLAAYCTADGSARFFQLTAKAVEKDPSRYREPHFLCGSLNSDDRNFTIKTPLSEVPLPNIPWKKVPTGMGDAPLFSYISDANQARGGSLLVSGDDQTPPVMKSKSKPNYSNKKSSSKKSDPGKPTCRTLTTEADEGTTEIIENAKEGPAQKIVELPPKDVAMHKVRWNMNKGSEKWLCYGGAAGIIRCQKISKDAMQ